MNFLIFTTSVFVACGFVGEITGFTLDTVPDAVPSYCFEPSPRGVCRAAMNRTRFDPELNDCEHFTYGGCGKSRNLFRDLQQCRRLCRRDPVQQRSYRNISQSCTFDLNLGGDCHRTVMSALGDDTVRQQRGYGVCARRGVVGGTPYARCRRNGCCWQPMLHFCYQKHSGLVRTACRIVYDSAEGFFGKVIFSSDRYRSGWNGQLYFSQPIVGAICILRDPASANAVQVGRQTYRARTAFTLHSSAPVYEGVGNSVVVFFSASYQPGHAYTAGERCAAVNNPSPQDSAV